MSYHDRFAVELHMVHHSDDGNITVIAVLYRHGKPDPFLFQVNFCDTLIGHSTRYNDQNTVLCRTLKIRSPTSIN